MEASNPGINLSLRYKSLKRWVLQTKADFICLFAFIIKAGALSLHAKRGFIVHFHASFFPEKYPCEKHFSR